MRPFERNRRETRREKQYRTQPVGAARRLMQMRTHVRTQVLTNAAMWERDSRGLTMQINYVALNKRMPLHRVFFTNGHIYIYGPWEYFLDSFFLSLLSIICTHLVALVFFLFFFSILSSPPVPPSQGMGIIQRVFFIITIVFFCLRMNPAHKFRGIFFSVWVFFLLDEKNDRDRQN